MLAAAQRPDEWAAMRADPTRIPCFVEEAGRLWPRIVHAARVSDVDTDLRGVSVEPGTPVLVVVPSVHRDPSMFPDPLRFDPTRAMPPSSNLNYGSGRHHCIGAALARMEMVGAIEVLTRRWAAVELADDPILRPTFGTVTVEKLALRVCMSRGG